MEAQLKTYLAKYKYKDAAVRDVLNAFAQFKDLRPAKDWFTFNNGARSELVNISGTIPVMYKSNTYNIPISVHLMDTHPYNSPTVFVTPTQTMQIRQTRNVDANGKVSMPFLQEWKYPQSDLHSLLTILAITFGEECPVFSRQSSGNQPPAMQPPARQGYPAPQPPPNYHQATTPASGYASMPTPAYPSTQYPRPNTPAYPSYPQYNPQSQGPTPYLPTNPPAARYPPQQTGYPPQTTQYPSYPPQSYPGYPQPPPQNQPQPAPQPNLGYPAPYPPNTGTPTTTAMPTKSQTENTSSLSDEEIKMSLLSAVEDKIKRRLQEVFAQAEAEVNVLKKTQEELQTGRTKLEQMIQQLESECSEVEHNISLLNQRDIDLQEAIAKLEKQSDFDVDEAVVPSAPLYGQIFQAFAEEQAIEDTIYHLGEALKAEVIDIETYLKKVRELSRRQFMLKAQIYKCREKAGLPSIA